MPIRVILADDHALVRDGVRKFLADSADIEVVAEAGTGKEAIELVQRLKPDVLLLDIGLPDMDGVQVTQRLKSEGLDTSVNILAFSGHDDREMIQGMLNMGASGYLTKDEMAGEIIDAIRGVANGQQGWLSQRVRAVVMSIYRGDEVVGWQHKVTPREAQVCECILEGKTNRTIAYELSISEKTVEKHITRLFEKFNVFSRVELAVYISRENQSTMS
jgi:DNA-binding NarL/FixJ family response regulator